MSGAADAKIDLVATYLRRELREQTGPLYIKSRFIAEDLSLSAQEIGTALTRLAERDGTLSVERWAESGGGITWCVRPQ